MNARMTAALAAGIISALATLAAVRGLPLGGVLFWFTPLPLFALAFVFGPTALPMAAGAGALVSLISGGPPATVVWVLLFSMPVSLMAALAMRGGPALVLGLPFAMLALWPALLLAGAELALAGEPGGLSAALRRAVEQALARVGAAPDVAAAEMIDTVVRLKPLAFAAWFAAVTALNASLAQGLVARRGLLLLPPARWSEATLPRWYAPVAVVPALIAGLAPGEPGFLAQGLALMLAVPLVLQGLAVVHVISFGKPARIVLLAGIYVGLVVFLLPFGLVLAGLGLAEFLLNLRGRVLSRGGQQGRNPGQTPPDD